MKIPIIAVIVLLIVVLGYAFIGRPMLKDKQRISTSDSVAHSDTVRIAGDPYLGYFFMNSDLMKKTGPQAGINVAWTDDKGAYKERLKKFARGEYDAIVIPAATYIQHGANTKPKYPGVIVASISESRGADAMLVFPDKIPADSSVNVLNDASLKFSYTGDSPSSFLIDATIVDFDLDELKTGNAWRNELASSEEVYALAKKASKDRTIGDVFVMWEPEVSKAKDKLGMVQVWGSDSFAGYIVDVFVFHLDFLDKKPEVVQKFFTTYFRVLDMYASNLDLMLKDMSTFSGINRASVDNVRKNIDWYDGRENCRDQFGISLSIGASANDGIMSSIIRCSDILTRVGRLDPSKLIDPYIIVNSSVLETLVESGGIAFGAANANTSVDFPSLTDVEWDALKVVGVMRIDPITFKAGSYYLNDEGKEVADQVADMLTTNYPNYRILVKGHTGNGDLEANTKLSQDRAEVVIARLVAVYDVDGDRLRARGMADTEPPKPKPGESMRALKFRKPRVEFVLLEGPGI